MKNMKNLMRVLYIINIIVAIANIIYEPAHWVGWFCAIFGWTAAWSNLEQIDDY